MKRDQMTEVEPFDRVVHALTRAVSRRSALGGLLAGALGLSSVQTETATAKLKPCPPCKKRKQGKCKKKLPDGTACSEGICQSGNCVAATPQTPLTCASAECTAACTVACYNATIEPCLIAGMKREDAAQAKCDADEDACAAKCGARDFTCLNRCGATAKTCNDAAARQSLLDACACDRQFPCCSEDHICTGL